MCIYIYIYFVGMLHAETRWSTWPAGSGRAGPGRVGSRRAREFATDPVPNAPRK